MVDFRLSLELLNHRIDLIKHLRLALKKQRFFDLKAKTDKLRNNKSTSSKTVRTGGKLDNPIVYIVFIRYPCYASIGTEK